MRKFAIWMLVLTVFGSPAVAREDTVEELKARLQRAAPQDRPPLCVQIAERQLRSADLLFRDGDVEKAHAAVDDIVTYSEQARESSVATRKHLKNVEIAMRKIAERLRDVKRSLSIEDQPAVQHAVERLEDIRTALLKQMFSKEKK